jgi:hypothetical protein
MVKNHDDIQSMNIEKMIFGFLDILSSVDPTICAPFLEVENMGDGVFVSTIVFKILEPRKEHDYEQS